MSERREKSRFWCLASNLCHKELGTHSVITNSFNLLHNSSTRHELSVPPFLHMRHREVCNLPKAMTLVGVGNMAGEHHGSYTPVKEMQKTEATLDQQRLMVQSGNSKENWGSMKGQEENEGFLSTTRRH
jgi:hypothetical protein